MPSIAKAFRFQGRTSRAGYWRTVLLITVLVTLVWIATIAATMQGLPGGWLFLLMAPLVWMNVAVAVRRLHDRNKSAWWIIPFSVLPLASYGAAVAMAEAPDTLTSHFATLPALLALVLSAWGWIELGFLKGAKGDNRYGAA